MYARRQSCLFWVLTLSQRIVDSECHGKVTGSNLEIRAVIIWKKQLYC